MMDHRDPHTCFPSCVSTPSPRGPLSLLPTYMVPQPPVPAPISSLGCPLFRRKSKEVIMEKQNFVGLVCSYSLVSFYFQLNTGTLYAATTEATAVSWALCSARIPSPDGCSFLFSLFICPCCSCIWFFLCFSQGYTLLILLFKWNLVLSLFLSLTLLCIGVQPIHKQCCDSFRWPAKGLGHTYTCIHPLPNSPPIQAAT